MSRLSLAVGSRPRRVPGSMRKLTGSALGRVGRFGCRRVDPGRRAFARRERLRANPLTITSGTTVTWTNNGHDCAHIDVGHGGRIRFGQHCGRREIQLHALNRGTLTYHCTFHTGKVAPSSCSRPLFRPLVTKIRVTTALIHSVGLRRSFVTVRR